MSPAVSAVLVAGSLALLLTGSGADTAIVANRGKSADELLRLEDEFAAGLVRRDEAAFRRLLADGFIYTENDRMLDGEALIKELTAGTDKVEAAHNEDMQVHRFGGTALVTGWLVVRGHGVGGAFNRRYRFTDTWLQRRNRWQLIGAHDYLAP